MAKPLRVGKAFRIPNQSSLCERLSDLRLSQLGQSDLGLKPSVIATPATQTAANMALKVPYFDEFSPMFVEEIKMKKKHERQLRMKQLVRGGKRQVTCLYIYIYIPMHLIIIITKAHNLFLGFINNNNH